MKKLTVLLFLFAFAVSIAQGQLIYKQIANGAKGVDSIAGGAPAGGTTKYYYFNMTGTATSGLSVYNVPITQYLIEAIMVHIALPTVAGSVPDSTQITFEISYDNSNWVKWTNAGATTPATQTQYKNGGPKVFGSGAYTYAAARDMVATTTTAGGAVFMPLNCYAPYLRVKLTAFKASSSAYPKIVVALRKL